MEVAVLDLGKKSSQLFLHAGIHGDAAMAGDVPVWKESQFARQQRIVIGRQHVGARGQLPADQRVHRIHVHLVDRRASGREGVQRGLLLDHLHHGLCAQVAQQHEAMRLVPGQHARCVQPGPGHQFGYLDEGRAVFERRRCVHDDAAASALADAQVTPEAGVSGCQMQCGRIQLEARAGGSQPLRKGSGSCRVGPDNRRACC